MMRLPLFLLILFAVLLVSCEPKSDPLPPYRFYFGLVQDGKIIPVPDHRIPFRPGTEYGWRLDLENPEGTVHVKQIFTLPSPTAWTFGNEQKPPNETEAQKKEQIQIEQSGQVLTKEMEINARKDIFHLSTYRILASDPLGKYRLELFLDGKLAVTCEFTLVPEDPTTGIRFSEPVRPQPKGA